MTEQTHCIECDDLSCNITSSPTLAGLQKDIHRLRYASDDHETWEQTCRRAADAIASVEGTIENRKKYGDAYYSMVNRLDFIPGGRILRNAGKVKGNLLNCFVLGVEDTIESIAKLYSDSLVISKYGGGIGVNASALRPAGEELKSQGANSRSSGMISFLDGLDYILKLIRGGGDRRAAGLGLDEVWHPEIFNFIDAKHVDGRLKNFNLSVGLSASFIKAVKNDKNWDLVFNNKIYKTVKAKDLWDYLIKNAWEVAEPGLINLDKMQRENNLWYCETIKSTNPCGEIPLPENGACCLGSINLGNMYDIKKGEINWKKLRETISLAIRFLDSVLDVTYYPITEIGLTVQATRRIGLGVMGLHHLMLKLGIKEYGSDEALEFMDEFFRKFRDASYLSSCLLAQERGPFDKFMADKFIEGEFIGRLPRRIRKTIRSMGIRNGTINSIAPTGTISLLAGTSQGIEPIFSPIYKRKYYAGDDIRETIEFDGVFKEAIMNNDDLSHFNGAYDIAPNEHLEVQNTVQQYIDNSISKTINMAHDYPVEKLSSLLLDHIEEIKGTTVYRSGSRGEEILTPCEYKMPREQLLKLLGK